MTSLVVPFRLLQPTGAVARLSALQRSLSTIEFGLDGTILDANANFLALMGYTLAEIKGRHHSIFVDKATAAGADYASFWERLRAGVFQSAEYKRFAKDGREVWIQATYNPIETRSGKTRRILKCAMDVTATKLLNATYSCQIDAINKSQGVIHFDLDGIILDVNPTFLAVVGYGRDEVVGKHHAMFVGEDEAQSWDYTNFWAQLRSGKFQRAQFRRYGKNGKEIWLQATYNPILDLNGMPFRVVKYATDISQEKKRALETHGEIAAINRAQCVVHFDADGHVLEANDNFLDAFGYRPAEVIGRHHSMFVDPDYAASREYESFWQKLRRGEFHSASFRRIAKSGRDVYIQATYNPIKDDDGRTFKVVKYATDITDEVRLRRDVTDAAQRTAHKVQIVADAAVEMSSTFTVINGEMIESRQLVDAMHTSANDADRRTVELRRAAQAMDGVISSISRIAEQINLLSLNATIEATRAGEAGRGFSTVASEVKTLANRAAGATASIREQIGTMQEAADKMVDSIGEITGTIGHVKGFVTRASLAMEDQQAVTREISSNMNSAAYEISDISRALAR